MRHSFLLTNLALVALIVAPAACVRAQVEAPRAKQEAGQLEQNAVFLAWRGNVEVQRCGVCHYSPGNAFAQRNTEFCRLTETAEWLQRDKHAIARLRIEPIARDERGPAVEKLAQRLINSTGEQRTIEVPEGWIGESNFLSYAMCEQLGYTIETEEGYQEFRKNCLTCHAGFSARETDSQVAHEGTNQPGISCNYCHQSGSDNRWIDEHSSIDARTTWRTLAPAVKQTKGMRQLTSVEAQSQLCNSCHIGDIKKQMFVTHAMFAAGHPPLPGIELGSLVEAMPRHWRSNRELAESLRNDTERADYFAKNFPELVAAVSPQLPLERIAWKTYATLGGAVAAQQQALTLVEQAAAAESNHWGDYALYDCATCHHEFRKDSWRQSKRSGGAPGRPRLVEWPSALSQAMLRVSPADAVEVNERSLSLKQAVAAQPFGNRGQVAETAARLNAALKRFGATLAAQSQSDSFVLRLLEELAAPPDEALIDYYAAKQINWAIRAIDAERNETGRALPPTIRTTIAELGQGSSADEPLLSQSLPAGQSQAIYPTFLKLELKRQAAYDGEHFRRQLDKLAMQLAQLRSSGQVDNR